MKFSIGEIISLAMTAACAECCFVVALPEPEPTPADQQPGIGPELGTERDTKPKSSRWDGRARRRFKLKLRKAEAERAKADNEAFSMEWT